MRGLAIGDFWVVAVGGENGGEELGIHAIGDGEASEAALRIQWISKIIPLMRHALLLLS